jgi:hypothetical protein
MKLVAWFLRLSQIRCLVMLAVVMGLVSSPTWAATKSENVILVTLDGVRCQEVFGGADSRLLMTKAGGARDAAGTRAKFWRETPEARRQVLMPFLWSVVSRQGQVFGDPQRNCSSRLVNTKKESRAGYSEMLYGFVDEQAAIPPVNVLEWMNTRPGFKGRVSLYACWKPLRDVLNAERGGFTAFAGWEPLRDLPLTDRERCLNDLMPDMPRPWPEAVFDFVIMQASLEHLSKRQPRLFHISLNDTDECAHDRRYDMYLQAIQNGDRFIQRFWETLQSMPQYASKTTLIIAADHGRGNTDEDWVDHGKDVPGSEAIWMAILGPDTPPLGVRQNQSVTLSQIAATLTAAVGEDSRTSEPRRSPPLPGAIELPQRNAK